MNSVIKTHESNVSLGTTVDEYHTNNVNSRKSSDETSSYIREARIVWEKGINDELDAISNETRKPLVSIR